MQYDVVVVGAGPAGSMTAKTASESGATVLLLEKHQAIGTPAHCGEALWAGVLAEVGVTPDPKWVANTINGGYFITPKGGKVVYTRGEVTGLIIERKVFDKSLAAEASRTGTEIMLRTRAVGVVKEGRSVEGIKAVREGEELVVESKMVVAADGVESKVARWAGMNTRIRLNETMSCYQYEMVGVRLDEPDMLEMFFGKETAPQGYAWIIPKGNDVANIGVGVRGQSEHHAKTYLDAFIKRNDRLNQAKVIEVRGGAVPVGGPLDRLVCDGLLVVGTAAHLVDPFSGGGIASALRSGFFAGRVIGQALREGRFDAERLLEYQRTVMDGFGGRWKRNVKLRRAFDRMSDDDLEVFLKLMPELREVLYRGREGDVIQKISYVIKKAPELAKFLKLLLTS